MKRLIKFTPKQRMKIKRNNVGFNVDWNYFEYSNSFMNKYYSCGGPYGSDGNVE